MTPDQIRDLCIFLLGAVASASSPIVADLAERYYHRYICRGCRLDRKYNTINQWLHHSMGTAVRMTPDLMFTQVESLPFVCFFGVTHPIQITLEEE